MTQPVTPPPAPAAPYTVSIDLAKLPSVATALGVSLVSGAIVTSAAYSRIDGHLDQSNFWMGVLATLGLLGVAAVAALLVDDLEKKELLVSWPGAFGAAGAGIMLATLITNDRWSEHVAPIAALAIAVVGYLLTRSTPFVIVALGSLALLYARIFDDLFDTNTDKGGNVFMLIGGGVLVFVVAATAAGWLLPRTRVVTGVVTGIGGLVGMVGLLTALAATRAITSVVYSRGYDYAPPSEDELGSSSPVPLPGRVLRTQHAHDPFKNDVYMILLYCAALAALWFVCALLTDHVAFRLLVLATAIVVVPLASFALVTHHPTWWEVVTTLLGGLVLGAIGIRDVLRPPPGAPPAPATTAPPAAPPPA